MFTFRFKVGAYFVASRGTPIKDGCLLAVPRESVVKSDDAPVI